MSFPPMVTGVTKPVWPIDRGPGRSVHNSGILGELILYTSRYFIRSSSRTAMGGKGLKTDTPLELKNALSDIIDVALQHAYIGFV